MMKNTVGISLLLAASVALSFSCSKELENPVSDAPVSGEPFTITVSIPNDMTKIAFTQENKGEEGDKVKLTWENSDELVIIDNADATVSRVFSISSITDEGKTATFELKSGQEEMFTSSNGKYNILYGAANMEAALAMDYSSQTQTGDAALDGLKGKYIALVEGVNTLEGIKLSETWAAAPENGGGSFRETGILRLWLQMPDAITSVASVIVNAPSAIFYKSNALVANERVSSLKLSFTGNATPATEGGKKTITAYLMLPWQEVSFTANTDLSILVKTGDDEFYSKSFTVPSGNAFQPGCVNSIKLGKSNLEVSEYFAGGSGTAADPWLIANATHMEKIEKNLSTSEKKYFKLIDDITLSSWTSIDCNAKGAIDFDGNNKSISGLNNPLFSFIDGKVSNLSITNATISTTGNYYGVLVRTISKENCVISKVNVIGGSISGGTQIGGIIGRITASSCEVIDCSSTVSVTANGIAGGLIGAISGGTITRCYSSGAVSANGVCGGFVGLMSGAGAIEITASYATGSFNPGGSSASGGFVGSIEGSNTSNFYVHDCYATGNLMTSNSYGSGGFVGKINKSAGMVSFSNCYATGNISVSYGYSRGGFAGRIEVSNVTIEHCAAWNGRIQGQTGLNKWSAGAIVGVAHPLCSLTDNYRNPSMVLHAYWGTSGQTKSLETSYQHDNVSSTSALVTYDKDGNLNRTTKTGLTEDGSSIFAYQGKCVAGQTLSQLANSTSYLNWGTTYWDYEQSLPRLKWTLPTE